MGELSKKQYEWMIEWIYLFIWYCNLWYKVVAFQHNLPREKRTSQGQAVLGSAYTVYALSFADVGGGNDRSKWVVEGKIQHLCPVTKKGHRTRLLKITSVHWTRYFRQSHHKRTLAGQGGGGLGARISCATSRTQLLSVFLHLLHRIGGRIQGVGRDVWKQDCVSVCDCGVNKHACVRQ